MSVKKVLVVDDSATERHMLQEMLRAHGYEVFTADCGEDGVAKTRELKPDLVLMDVVMPGLNGFQATRMLTRDDATKDIPVIMCTTKSTRADKVWATRQGAASYVTKPVDEEELLQRIAALN